MRASPISRAPSRKRAPAPTRTTSCEGKKRFSKATAKRLARVRSEEYGEGQHAYACRFCSHWHIGHNWTFREDRGRS